MFNEPMKFINLTDALRELDQLIINWPLEPERKLINACKRRLMELPTIHSAQLPPHKPHNKKWECPVCGYKEGKHRPPLYSLLHQAEENEGCSND